jgi:hypothetical protein
MTSNLLSKQSHDNNNNYHVYPSAGHHQDLHSITSSSLLDRLAIASAVADPNAATSPLTSNSLGFAPLVLFNHNMPPLMLHQQQIAPQFLPPALINLFPGIMNSHAPWGNMDGRMNVHQNLPRGIDFLLR